MIKIDNLELRIPVDIEFGSDDEKAMTNAVSDAFPQAGRCLCTKHMKDNVKHYLQNRVGVDTNERKEIMDSLFGALGIANADDTIDFEEKKSVELKDKLAEYPQFKTYFEKRLKERINSFVNVPRRHNKEISEKLWTNNNAESIHHVFKATNWKPQSTPELINKLYDCVDIQFYHLRGALRFSGNYMLIRGQEHYRIPDQLWRCKTSEENNDIFTSFLHDKKRKRTYAAMISSTDGTYAVPNKAKTIAKKSGQRKRPRTEKTQKR